MKNIAYGEMLKLFEQILLKYGFSDEKAKLISRIFADNSLDGVYSHGLNRFPIFIKTVKENKVNIGKEPRRVSSNRSLENWDGQQGAGMYNAWLSMKRSVVLAKENGIACVSLFNNNHWMRGGTYGWLAAESDCIGICFTNAVASMPPWGGKESRLGNNPIVIAVPRKEGHIVLDMAISQFSYGKMYEYELESKQLPYPGGFDENGELTTDPHSIRKTMRALPIGLWKGSGLAMLIDIVLTALSGGKSTADVTPEWTDTGVSQCFIAIHQKNYHQSLIENIIEYTKSAHPAEKDGRIYYPGERTLMIRKQNAENGIPVNEKVWERINSL
ncbi:MAG: 3-dehydro-L-gulonate 2-dehydrogenase [Weeksellaceae bacterium]